MKASAFRQKAEAERAAQIDQFLSNSAAPVPPGAEQAPIMLTLWNHSKVALFAALMTVVLFSLRKGN
jgi:hypothetical protein